MATSPQARFKLIVSIDGVNTPLYSGYLVTSKAALGDANLAVASLLTDADGVASLVVVQLTSAPVSVPVVPSVNDLACEDGSPISCENGDELVVI